MTLLRADPGRGLLLLEWLTASRSLAAEADAVALPVAADLLARLWVPPPPQPAATATGTSPSPGCY